MGESAHAGVEIVFYSTSCPSTLKVRSDIERIVQILDAKRIVYKTVNRPPPPFLPLHTQKFTPIIVLSSIWHLMKLLLLVLLYKPFSMVPPCPVMCASNQLNFAPSHTSINFSIIEPHTVVTRTPNLRTSPLQRWYRWRCPLGEKFAQLKLLATFPIPCWTDNIDRPEHGASSEEGDADVRRWCRGSASATSQRDVYRQR